MLCAHPAAHKAADILLAPPRACHHTPAAGVAEACSRCQQNNKQIAWPDHHRMSIMQASLEVQQETPAYVTATATFLSMIYPNQGLDRCLTREHIERMDGRDFLKVMHVGPCTNVCTRAASCHDSARSPLAL